MSKKLSKFKIDFRINRTRIIIVSLVILAFFLYAYIIYFSSVVPAAESYNSNISTVFKENESSVILMNQTEVTQTFIAKNEAAGFSLCIDKFEDDVQGIMQVALVDTENDNIIFQQQKELCEIESDDSKTFIYQEFIFDSPLIGVEGNEYKIVITTAGQQPRADKVSLIYSEENRYNNGKCTIDGVPIDGDLSFKVLESANIYIIPIYWACVIFIMSAFIVISYLLLKNKFKIEHLYLISVLSFGLMYMFMFTPMSIPDEPAHYSTAYRYSNFILLKGDAAEENHILMRADDAAFLDEFSVDPSLYEYNFLAKNMIKTVEDSTIVSKEVKMVETTPFIYFPAATGIAVARLIGLGSTAVFFCGRIANLIIFAFACFLSIRKMPFGKMIFFVISMLPMTLQQVSSYSYDAVIFGFSFLFISYCLSAAFGGTDLQRKDIVDLCLLGAFLAPQKAVYLFICFLVLVIPLQRYSTLEMRGNKRVKCLFAMLGSSILSFLVFDFLKIISMYANPNIDTLSTGKNLGYTVSYLLAHPGELFLIFRVTILNKSSSYFETMLGKWLGWMDIEVSSILLYAFFALLILSAIKIDNERVHLNKWSKIWIALISSSVFFLVCLAMLLSFTPATVHSIMGVQGRYFLPILPLALLFFRNDRIVVKKNMTQLIIFAVWALELLTVAYVLQWVIVNSLTM